MKDETEGGEVGVQRTLATGKWGNNILPLLVLSIASSADAVDATVRKFH